MASCIAARNSYVILYETILLYTKILCMILSLGESSKKKLTVNFI